MKAPLALAMVLAAVVPAAAADLNAQSAIDSVIVYPDGATITRLIDIDLPQGDTTVVARDFPPGLDISSLRVEGQGTSGVVIGAIDARAPRAERPATAPELEKRIEALKDERAVLDDKIAAETARKEFAQRFAAETPFGLGQKGEARPIEDWRTAFRAVADEIASADDAIRQARLRQREIDRALAALSADVAANPPRKMEVRMDVAASAPGHAVFRVSYTVRGARWAPLYDARLDSGARDRKPALELVRRAEIVQQTGEDWSNVALSVSTVRTQKGGNAPELRPLIVRYQEPAKPVPITMTVPRRDRVTSAEPEGTLSAPYAAAPSQLPVVVAEEREAAIETGGFQVMFRIPGRVSVATNEGAKSFRIATSSTAPELLVRATPALDETAFLEAEFKQADEAPLLPGLVSLYRDGIFVGRSRMALIPKDETVRLGFGADDKVKITRVVTRQTEGQTGLISSAKTDEREFKITVRNGHASPVNVTIEEQLPVSETADIQVEMLPSSTQPTQRDVRDQRGVLAWTMDLAAGETRDIKFGWRVKWPSDKSVVYSSAR